MNVDVDILYPLVNPALKSGIKGVHIQPEHVHEHFALGSDFSVLMDKLKQLLEAEIINNIFHNQIRLKIREAQVGVAAGAGKTSVKITHRQQAVLLHGADQLQPLAPSPLRTSLSLFPCGDAF